MRDVSPCSRKVGASSASKSGITAQTQSMQRKVVPEEKMRREESVDEIIKGITKALTIKFPPMMGVNGRPVPVKSPPQRKQPPPVKQVPAVWKSPRGVEAERPSPPARIRIGAEDAVSMARLRLPPGPPAQGVAVTSVSSAPPGQGQDLSKAVLTEAWGGLQVDLKRFNDDLNVVQVFWLVQPKVSIRPD